MSCAKCGTDCATFGECVRAKGLRIGWSRSASGLDLSAEKAKDKELALYASAVKQGVQPAGTRTPQIRHALERSEQTGKAYDAGIGD